MRAQVRQQRCAAVLANFARRRADVRRQHHLLHGQERGRHARLVPEHFESRARNAAVFQRLDQRRFVDDGAARDVDEKSLRSQRVENSARPPICASRASPGTSRSGNRSLRHLQQFGIVRMHDARFLARPVIETDMPNAITRFATALPMPP